MTSLLKFLEIVRGHVYPRAAIKSRLNTGELRASNAILGMVGVICATLVAAHLVMLVAGV